MIPLQEGCLPSATTGTSSHVRAGKVGAGGRQFRRTGADPPGMKQTLNAHKTAERCTRLISKMARRLYFGSRVQLLGGVACFVIVYALIFGNKFVITRSALSEREIIGVADSVVDSIAQNANIQVTKISSATLSQDPRALDSMSCVVLFHNEYDSLVPVLDSWMKNGLTDYVEEILFFLNGAESSSNFYQRIPAITRIAKNKLKVVAHPENLRIGLAIKKMVEMASFNYILLLEKDWQLVEPASIMRSRLQDSKVLVRTGTAQLVRHRHRVNPGVPIHALIMHDGRELAMMQQQPNLMCFVHHWQKDPTVVYPGMGIMYRCGGASYGLEEEDVYCSPAKFCQWTNNPALFKKDWFLKEIAAEYQKQHDLELAKEGTKSPFLDFEYYMNWRNYAWNDRNFTVAVGAGLFSHAETEHKHFNTFWYAFYRLRVDIEEVRNSYLSNETRFKSLGGVHFDPAEPKPLPLIERYPVKFVRRHQVPFAFTGNSLSQTDVVMQLYKPYVAKYRYLRVNETNALKETAARLFGADKANLQIPWRQLVTDMHFATEKAMMLAAPEQPHEMNITLVTSVLDIDRHTVDRDFGMYLDALRDWLRHEYPKVVYTTPDIVAKLLQNASEYVKSSTKFVYISREELRRKWIGPDNYDKIQEIRKDRKWRSRASWLSGSPQARLKDYNPLVMSKMYMVRDASRLNYWNTTHFLFLDVKHNCRNPLLITPRSDHIFRAHMFGKFLLTYFDYDPVQEVHGFEYQKFNEWINLPAANKVTVKVGRGGVFGGSAFILEAITAMYDVILTASLREGLMGTEENILSILMAQVPQYIDTFSNNWACREVVANDHKCRHPNLHYNCGIFVWAAENAPATPARDSQSGNVSII